MLNIGNDDNSTTTAGTSTTTSVAKHWSTPSYNDNDGRNSHQQSGDYSVPNPTSPLLQFQASSAFHGNQVRSNGSEYPSFPFLAEVEQPFFNPGLMSYHSYPPYLESHHQRNNIFGSEGSHFANPDFMRIGKLFAFHNLF